jgi:hypothetical protein
VDDLPSMSMIALPSIICAYVSKGEVYSLSPSPLANDKAFIDPVVFFMIDLLTTALCSYSINSTIL